MSYPLFLLLPVSLRLSLALSASVVLHLLAMMPSSFRDSPRSPLRLTVSLATTSTSPPPKAMEHQHETENVVGFAEMPGELATLQPPANDRRRIWHRAELDEPPRPLADLELEPAEGFPVYVSGSATFLLLIGDDGSVLWVTADRSDLDAETTTEIARRLQRARFTPPKAQGRAVMTVMKIEVNVKPATINPGQARLPPGTR